MKTLVMLVGLALILLGFGRAVARNGYDGTTAAVMGVGCLIVGVGTWLS